MIQVCMDVLEYSRRVMLRDTLKENNLSWHFSQPSCLHKIHMEINLATHHIYKGVTDLELMILLGDINTGIHISSANTGVSEEKYEIRFLNKIQINRKLS